MGGSALSKPSVRLDAATFVSVRDRIVKQLQSLFHSVNINYIPYYLSKESFGDLDILTDRMLDSLEVSMVIKALEVVQNSSITSYGIDVDGEMFQVDLIYAEPSIYNFALGYFSYNDLGNLIGRISHAAGFKFGHKGMSYVIREPDNDNHVLSEVLVTNNFNTALEFLGYDASKFLPETFITIEDVYRFAASSPYFSADIFQLHNRNSISRIRDKKRKTYMGFLKWLEKEEVKHQIPNFDYSDKSAFKLKMLKKAFEVFPSFLIRYLEVMEIYESKKKIYEKFNATIVSKVTRKTGKELGVLMKAIKKSVSENELVRMHPEDIVFLIKTVNDELTAGLDEER